ncbi:MAG: formylglycine-generating enzyme family protein [Deltaproteobacteria bacterium]|nr:formylglycine-generating enzyme family protein [Deltaproteobacteria bacterium]
MVLLPGGEFWMGTDSPRSMPNERPKHRVKLSQFWIDRTDVTNADYEAFVKQTGYKTIAERPVDWEELKKQLPPDTEKPADELLQPGSLVFTPPDHSVDLRDMRNWWTWTIGASWKHPEGPKSSIKGKGNYPVVQIAWEDAKAYCDWKKLRLPTEAEWEYAARGGLEEKRFAWGDTFMPNGKHMANTFSGSFPEKNTAEDGYAKSSPVKKFPPNGFGLYDMTGNVWNWTSDIYREDAHQKAAAEAAESHGGCLENPQGPLQGLDTTRSRIDSEQRVIKGGSFLCNASYCESYRPSARRGTPPDTGSEHVGFRCAKSAS